MTPWASACTSLVHSNSNATAFDFVCVHTERQRFISRLLSVSLSILILWFDAFLYPRIISLENFCSHLWHLKQIPDTILLEGKVTEHNHVIMCFFLPFSNVSLHCFSVRNSLYTFICAFLSWKLKAVFVNAKLESNPVMTSLGLYVRLGD